MDQDQKRTYLSWGLSAGLHVLVIFILAISGIFSFLLEKSQNPPVAVEVYDVDAGGSDSSGDGGAAPVDVPVDVIDDTAVPDPTQPTTPQDEAQTLQETAHAENTSSQGHAATADTGSGTGNEGAGTGSGSGSGNGTGDGNGDGTGVKRPKTPPSYVSGSLPAYPEALRKQSVQGTVVLSLLVGADGSVQEASIAASSGHSELDEAALAAAYSYQFTPATNANDEPVPCRVSWPVAFYF